MRQYTLIPILSLCLLSCIDGDSGKAGAVGASQTTLTADTTETFATFNERFHRDSAFQISRIAFPIGGHYAEAEHSHAWTAKNWELLKEPVSETPDTTEYRHNIQKSDTTVIEKYWLENSGFKTERHFKKIDGKWFLTYYDDINM